LWAALVRRHSDLAAALPRRKKRSTRRLNFGCRRRSVDQRLGFGVKPAAGVGLKRAAHERVTAAVPAGPCACSFLGVGRNENRLTVAEQAFPLDLMPRDYFSAATLRRATVWNLDTEHGPLDVTFTPSGFPHGYADLYANARPLTVAGTAITVVVAALADVEHSKRIADRSKDRDYLERVGRTAPGDSERRP
jgi:hypothetical protein